MNYNGLQYWIHNTDLILSAMGAYALLSLHVPHILAGIFTLWYFSLPNMFVFMNCTVPGMGSARMFFLPRKTKRRVHQSISPFLSPRRTSNLEKRKGLSCPLLPLCEEQTCSLIYCSYCNQLRSTSSSTAPSSSISSFWACYRFVEQDSLVLIFLREG